MSRSGRIPVQIPEQTEVRFDSGIFYAKGKLGSQEYKVGDNANVKLEGDNVHISPKDETSFSSKMWGTVRSQISNTILGVSSGFKKELQLNGVGYKASLKGKTLELLLGYSHPINFVIPEDIKVDLPKPTEIIISGISKHKVGQIAANIRSYRKPEPYKGKGIKYKDEVIRRKEGKKKWWVK